MARLIELLSPRGEGRLGNNTRSIMEKQILRVITKMFADISVNLNRGKHESVSLLSPSTNSFNGS